MPKRILTNSALWIPAAGMLLFALFWAILPEAQLNEVASSFVMSTTIMLAVSWWKPGYRAMRAAKGEGYAMLSLGLLFLGIWLSTQRLNINFLRWLDRPAWLLHLPISALTAWGIGMSVMLILLAPNTEKGRIPTYNFIWIGIVTFITGMLFGIHFQNG